MKTQENDLSIEDDIECNYSGYIFKAFHFMGLKLSLKKKTDGFKFVHKLPTTIGILQSIVVFFLQMNFIRDVVQCDSNPPIQIISQVISNIQAGLKTLLVFKKIEDIQRMLETLGEFWKKYSPDKNYRVVLFRELGKTSSLCKYYFGTLVGIMIAYDVQPLVYFLTYYFEQNATNHTYDLSRRILLVKYPFEITRKSTYCFLLSQEAYLLYITAIYWANGDTLFAQFTTHICLQLKILKYETGKFFNQSNQEGRSDLLILIRRHQELLSMCDMIEDIFSPIIFSTMLLSAINMCVNVIGVTETIAAGSYEETGIYTFIFIATFLQIIFYCVFAETLTEETRSLSDFVYNLEWTSKDYRLRFLIQVIILRAQTPVYCTAYGFFPIGHQKLTSVASKTFEVMYAFQINFKLATVFRS
ncbi:odorant receptor 280 isoform X2 [Nasonia vitripennis]|uniref:Odorant receptor n=1 Tax=Nasonia vitripennis TaxID=7425 RepID=A0A7M7M2U0_NASVI|nr:odorant receptor 280 isoform X2 [Nasonia vitripennis]